MGTTITARLDLQTCFDCGVPFGLEVGFKEQRVSDKRRWYCPNGHGQVYTGESYANQLTRLKAELGQEYESRKYYQRRNVELIEDVKTQTRKAAAAKGQLTKSKRRADNGVCPHCSRTFARMADHIKTVHPTVDVATGTAHDPLLKVTQPVLPSG